MYQAGWAPPHLEDPLTPLHRNQQTALAGQTQPTSYVETAHKEEGSYIFKWLKSEEYSETGVGYMQFKPPCTDLKFYWNVAVLGHSHCHGCFRARHQQSWEAETETAESTKLKIFTIFIDKACWRCPMGRLHNTSKSNLMDQVDQVTLCILCIALYIVFIRNILSYPAIILGYYCISCVEEKGLTSGGIYRRSH